jgi:hypothetical protein
VQLLSKLAVVSFIVTSGALALTAQNTYIEVRLSATAQPLAAQSSASASTTYTMEPSVKPAGGCALSDQPQTLSLDFFVRDFPSMQPITNSTMKLEPQAVDGTGGHLHSGDRPAGQFDPDSGITDATGIVHTTFTAPEVSGVINVKISGVRGDTGDPLRGRPH